MMSKFGVSTLKVITDLFVSLKIFKTRKIIDFSKTMSEMKIVEPKKYFWTVVFMMVKELKFSKEKAISYHFRKISVFLKND